MKQYLDDHRLITTGGSLGVVAERKGIELPLKYRFLLACR
jgi:hypothetical protein